MRRLATRAAIIGIAGLVAASVATGCRTHAKAASLEANQGVAAFEAKEYEKAKRHFGKALELEPKDAASLYHLGLLQLVEKDAKSAAITLNKAVEADPRHAESRYHYARAQVALGASKDAEVTLKGLFALDMSHPGGHTLAGEIREAAGDLDGADEEWRKAIDGDPGHTNAYLRLAELYRRVGALRDAEAVLREGMRFASMSVELPDALGRVLLEAGNPDAAADAFGRVLDKVPERASTQYNLASALILANQPGPAARALRTYATLIADKADEATAKTIKTLIWRLENRAAATKKR